MMEENHRILVIDDNLAIHNDLRKIFLGNAVDSSPLLADEDLLFGSEELPFTEAVKFEIDSAYQGQDGLALVEGKSAAGLPYALAFVDVRMPPGWDGVETIRRLWAVDPALQVVICTAFSDYSWEDIRQKLGFSDNLLILKKPFDKIEAVQLAHAMTRKWVLAKQAHAKLGDLDSIVNQRTLQLETAHALLKQEFAVRAKAEEAFRVVFEASPIAIGLLDQDLRFVDVNSALAELCGIERDDVFDKDPRELRWVSDREEMASLFSSIRENGGIDQYQFEIQTASGKPRICLMWAREVIIRSVAHVLCFVLDISGRVEMEHDLRRARSEAEAATSAKSQFLATMSHEIRTPLNGVLGLSTFLEDADLPEHVQEIGTFIRRSGEMLRRVLDDVLDFSKIESGRLDLEEVPFSLREVLDWSVGLYKQAAQEKNLRLAFSIEESRPDRFVGDPTRLRQVLTNLISNAIKFTNAGSVTVSASVQADPTLPDTCQVRISVSDTGIGIPEDRMHRLFHSFTQVDASTNRRFGGTGLGLVISKRLIELMGGDIVVTSEIGVGSTFAFELRLPIAAPAPPHEAAPDLPVESQRILVVEDNPINSLVIERMLKKLGHTVVLAGDGETAIHQVRNDDCQLVLMDVNMPGLDGLQATRHIRSLPSSRARVPIIALTASALADDRQDCLAAGMDDFLSKPISLEALKKTIIKWSAVSTVAV